MLVLIHFIVKKISLTTNGPPLNTKQINPRREAVVANTLIECKLGILLPMKYPAPIYRPPDRGHGSEASDRTAHALHLDHIESR